MAVTMPSSGPPPPLSKAGGLIWLGCESAEEDMAAFAAAEAADEDTW